MDDLCRLSSDSFVDSVSKPPWYSLIHQFTQKGLEALRNAFKRTTTNNKEEGLSKDEFKEAICEIFENTKYDDKSFKLFDDIAQSKLKINWNDFLDFLIENICPKTDYPVQLYVGSIEAVPHMSRETISKIVVIETEKYFCYCVVSKHGRIGIYDGNLNFLTSYHVIMTREDLDRSDDERRRKNRWITDAIFCLDIQMFIVTNSTRNVAIYEASGLKHEPYWLIIGVPEIIECLAYRRILKQKVECILFGGTGSGDILLFKFVQPEKLLLRKKHIDKISIFYWCELKHEQAYLKVKVYKNVHSTSIEQMDYNEKEDAVISCSKDPDVSLVKKFISVGKIPYILKIRKGCNCFAFSNILNILVTGSSDKIIRIWNSVLISNVLAILRGHNEKIIDVAIMDTQHMVLSFSEDGILKLWNINENKCLQTEKIKYPAYTTLGKYIEYGRKNIYPGPKRSAKYLTCKDETSLYNKYFGITEVEERPAHVEDVRGLSGSWSIWERSNILLTCCNYIAYIRINYQNKDIEKSNEMTILPPPPLQNTVLIPASWQIRTEDLKKEREEELEKNVEETIKQLEFIIKKDLFDIEGSRSDINYKISILESRKMQMEANVIKGAPYLALDLRTIEELKINQHLRIPNTKNIKIISESINKMIKGASVRDQAFSKPSSSKSSKSSRSSLVLI